MNPNPMDPRAMPSHEQTPCPHCEDAGCSRVRQMGPRSKIVKHDRKRCRCGACENRGVLLWASWQHGSPEFVRKRCAFCDAVGSVSFRHEEWVCLKCYLLNHDVLCGCEHWKYMTEQLVIDDVVRALDKMPKL